MANLLVSLANSLPMQGCRLKAKKAAELQAREQVKTQKTSVEAVACDGTAIELHTQWSRRSPHLGFSCDQ
jgi:hypothetical protein